MCIREYIGHIELQRQFNSQQYQKNIQALRAGTALESTEFVQLMRERAQHEFKADFALIVDPTIYGMDAVEQRTIVGKDDDGIPLHQYPQPIYKLLRDDITEQYQDVKSVSEAKLSSSNALLKTLNEEEENRGLSYILDGMIDDSASANHFKVQNQNITTIVPQMSVKSSLQTICDKAGWDTSDVKLTSFDQSIDDLSTLDHEIGHAFLYEHLNGETPLEHLGDDEYSSYIHECVADSVAVFSAIHDGRGQECFDMLSLERAYSGLNHMDTEHFTNATLQHLKESTCIEHIQSLPDKKAVAEHALLMVLGDKEQDIKPTFLSKKSFDKQTEIIETLGDKINYHAEVKGLETLTPLQINELIKDGFFEEEQIQFLNRYVTYHKDTIVHKKDVELGLVSQQRFDNPNLADNQDNFFEPVYNNEKTDFETEIVREIFPLDDEGIVVNISIEERLHILQHQERILEQGECSEEQSMVIQKYKKHLYEEKDFHEMRAELKHSERSSHYIEKESSQKDDLSLA